MPSPESGSALIGPWSNLSQRGVRIATFLLLLFIIVERGLGRLVMADLWGEDGAFFVREALTQGVTSLLSPVFGSFFTIERLVVLVTLHTVPLAWMPRIVCLIGYVILAGIMSRFTAREYAWLIPSQLIRVAAACLFCLLPGLNEMAGNMSNLNWILFCWLALVGIKDPSDPVTAGEIATTVLVTLSIGTSVLLLPLFAWRVWMSLRRFPDRRTWIAEAVQLGIVAGCGVFVPWFFGGQGLPGSHITSYFGLARTWYDHLARLAAFTPWLGDRMTYVLSTQYAMFYRIGKVGFLVVAILWGWARRHDPRAQALLLLTISVSTWTVLAVLTRPYALDALQGQGAPAFYESRYAFIVSFAGVMFWLCTLAARAPGNSRLATAMLPIFIVLNIVLSLHRFNIPAYGAEPHRFNISAYGPERRWQATLNALERSMATGCPRTVDVRQYPDPWRFTYVSPRPAADCNPFTAVLPSIPKDITWMRGPCTSGYVERVEWVGETRVRATGWAYPQEFGRPADAVLVTRKQAGSLVPTAAAIVTIPRGDVAAQLGTDAVVSGWSVEFDLPRSHDPLEFWVLDAGRRLAQPSCALSGSYEPAAR